MPQFHVSRGIMLLTLLTDRRMYSQLCLATVVVIFKLGASETKVVIAQEALESVPASVGDHFVELFASRIIAREVRSFVTGRPFLQQFATNRAVDRERRREIGQKFFVLLGAFSAVSCDIAGQISLTDQLVSGVGY